MSRIDDLRALHETAHDAPWAWEPHGDGPGWSLGIVVPEAADPACDDAPRLSGRLEPGEGDPVVCIAERGIDGADADAALIVAARNALPALLDVVSAAETYARSGHRSGPTGCVVPAEDGGWVCVCGLDALRAALDRLEASTHDASGGPPAPHRRPSEDLT